MFVSKFMDWLEKWILLKKNFFFNLSQKLKESTVSAEIDNILCRWITYEVE